MKYLTTCRITKADGSVCGQEFTANELPDQTEQTKQGRAFVEGLMKHVEKKHPEAYLEIQTRWLSFLGFLVLGCFDLQDPKGAQFKQTLENVAYQSREVTKTA
ncbi:MAG TPA: hypothetical protein VMQ76_02635 [Terracidiphilus sp.]|jgi:hypothetical protein|nr:hypothetical protein [Terracidiphilus sp.]